MTRGFFERLEVELGGLTHQGVHIDPVQTGRRRTMEAMKRGVAVAGLCLTLAASLDSEFPAAASGRSPVSQARG